MPHFKDKRRFIPQDLPIPKAKLRANIMEKTTKNPAIMLHPSDPFENVFSIFSIMKPE